MPQHVLDAGVIVELAKMDAFALLGGFTAAETRHPTHFARYRAAITSNLLKVVPIVAGDPVHVEFMRLRASRTSPQRNRGEDACIALTLVVNGSLVYVKDNRSENKAVKELGATRVRGLTDVPGWPPAPPASTTQPGQGQAPAAPPATPPASPPSSPSSPLQPPPLPPITG